MAFKKKGEERENNEKLKKMLFQLEVKYALK